MFSTQRALIEPELYYEVTDPLGLSQRLWLLAGCLKTNLVHVYEGVIVPVLWSRGSGEPIVSTDVLSRKIRTEHFDGDNTYELFLADAQENGKDVGMVLARSFQEEHVELLTEYVKEHIYEEYEQFLFRPWSTQCVGLLKKFVADRDDGIIATMHVPGFGTIPGVSQKMETNISGVLVYSTQ